MTQQPHATTWRPHDDVGDWCKLQSSPVIWGGVAVAIFLTATQSLTGEIQQQSQTLLKITEQEAALRCREGHLAENLQTVREPGTIEETLHTLNAVVHLLTNRAPLRAA